MKRMYSSMRKMGGFVDNSPIDGEVRSKFCNDVLLVHVRNVMLPKQNGGDCKLKLLNERKWIVTFIGRSELHMRRIINCMNRSQIDDNDFKSFESQFIYSSDQSSLKERVEEYINELNNSRK